MKIQTITTNFTGGERSPRMFGRVDLERNNSSADLLRNCVVLRQGGATIRPPLDYKGEVKDSADAGRLAAFVFSRTDAYLLEFGDLYIRFWKDGELLEVSPGTPYEVVTPFAASELAGLDWTQQADTMIIASGVRPLKRLRRFADTNWQLDDAPLNPGPLAELGERLSPVSMTISNAAVGTGRTVTASAGFFLDADVGRVIRWAGGEATITAFGTSTSVTASVTLAFASTTAAHPDWVLDGTPQTQCDPSIATPVGATTTLTLSANGWRSNIVGNYVEINGGLVKISVRTSATIVTGEIMRELTGDVAAPTGGWALLTPIWNEADEYPQTVTFYEQRLWAGNTARYPQTMWGSEPGLYFRFSPGALDDSAVYKTLDSDDVNVIQFLSSLSTLIALTYGGEFEARGGVEQPITQLNCQIKKYSRWGSDAVRPEEVGDELFYVQRGGTVLRVLSRAQVDGFVTRDVSVFSEHVFRAGIVAMTWEQTPEQVLWVATADGGLNAVTYSAEQNVLAICSGSATGAVESLATVPDGDVDATYCLVRRTIGGVTQRYIERLNWDGQPGQDSRIEQTGAASATWGGLSHLIGQTVTLVADGVYVGTAVVNGSGQVTLPRTATTLSAGLAYTASITLAAPEVGTGTGTSQGQNMSTHRVLVRFLETVGCKINGQEIPFARFGSDLLDTPPTAFTGFKDVTSIGWDKESPITLSQEQPYPWTVLGVVRDFTVNAG